MKFRIDIVIKRFSLLVHYFWDVFIISYVTHASVNGIQFFLSKILTPVLHLPAGSALQLQTPSYYWYALFAMTWMVIITSLVYMTSGKTFGTAFYRGQEKFAQRKLDFLDSMVFAFQYLLLPMVLILDLFPKNQFGLFRPQSRVPENRPLQLEAPNVIYLSSKHEGDAPEELKENTTREESEQKAA